MLRSMYAGISGMRANQTKLDVLGNNISNSGTTAFKGSRVRFQDMLSQNVSQAVGPSRNLGGVNPMQVGLGVQVAGIDTDMSQGVMQPTNRNLDAAIDGDGYFIVATGSLPTNNNLGINVDENNHTITSSNGFSISYTRDGSFTLDSKGNLLNSNGYRIMGYALKEKNNSSSSVSIDYNANGVCNFVDCDAKDGLEADSVLVPLRIPSSVHVNASIVKKANSSSTPPIPSTYMDYTGTASITGITAPTIDTNDNKYVGSSDLKLEIKYDDSSSSYHLYVNGDDKGNITQIYVDTDGNISTSAPGGTEGTDYTEINITNPSGVPAGDEEKYSWSYTLRADADKKITSFSIEKDGQIKATLEDGKVAALGQIAMASFNNTAGLKKLGKNLYQNTSNSGVAIIRSAVGADPSISNSDGYGDINQGVLEMSNVDLAEQFTDMIVASRSFQANGKMITTGDEILQDIINLKR